MSELRVFEGPSGFACSTCDGQMEVKIYPDCQPAARYECSPCASSLTPWEMSREFRRRAGAAGAGAAQEEEHVD